MAFNIDPSISLNVKPPQAMSLGDMLNIARGAQEYQQRQKLNPVELETAESEKEKSLLGQRLARETLAPKIEQQKFQTESAGTQLNTQKLENTRKHFENVVQNISTLITKPDLTRDDIINRATEINKNAGGNEQSLKQTLAGLPETNNVNDLRAFLAQGLTKSIGGLSQLDKLAPGGVYPSQLPQLDNAPRGTNDNMPVTSDTLKGNVQNMSKPTHSQPSQLSYPVRTPTTVTPYAPTEKADQDAGFKTRNMLVERQSTITTDRRNIDEVVKAARQLEKEALVIPGTHLESTKGAWGALSRGWANLTDSSKYKQLSKDLANVQISNTLAKGGSLDTVNGQQLVKAANGDETFPPDVLINIANRAKADMTELDLKATAAQKFSQKFGDNNFKAFQQMWTKNADSKIFELYNISKDPDLSAKEKEAAKTKLFPKNEKERKVFIDKYLNIKKLEETGSL
jgi:hypothetical protein